MAGRLDAARTLVAFLLALALAYGLLALTGTWQPRWGTDLGGGTRITLVAQDDASADELEQARDVVEQRVRDSGLAEGEVVVLDGGQVVVEVPGESRRELVDTVARRSQLRIRLVADSAPGAPSASPDESTGASPSGSPSSSPSASPSDLAEDVDPLRWKDDPGEEWRALFAAFDCSGSDARPSRDDADQPLLACAGGSKYLLSPAVIEGTDVDSASTRAPAQEAAGWAVTLDFDDSGTDAFTEMSQALAGTQDQFAVVLDGTVVSTPTMRSVITNGQAEITGGFDEAGAASLATSIGHGSLPVSFEPDPVVELVGPTLAGSHLRAGIVAAAVGLLLVLAACLAFYRGLGLVVVASMLVWAALAYGLLVLAGEALGFRLSLPGLAGVAVALGVAADSSVVLLERVRQEMRGGLSAGRAVEKAWAPTRRTVLAADAVSLLVAVVLYVFAPGDLEGFAVALGLCTLVDLAVFFAFTRPALTQLVEKPFFRAGHRWSGLGRGSLGVAR